MCISESNKNLIAKSAENERKVKKRGKRKKGEQGERERGMKKGREIERYNILHAFQASISSIQRDTGSPFASMLVCIPEIQK